MTTSHQRFWKSVTTVLTGMAIAQAIPLIGSLVITRLYSPSEYGLFATWLGLASLTAVAITGRFEAALAQEPDGEPRRVAVVATLVAVAIASFVLILLLVGGAFAGVLGATHELLWTIGVPAAALLAVAQTWQSWAAADGRYRDLSVMRIAQALTATGAQIVIGMVMPFAGALALAHLAGVAFGIVVAAVRLPLGFHAPSSAGWRKAITGFWSRQRRFPILALPADSINTATGQLPLLVVSSRFGVEIAGWLALAMRMLGGPISLLGTAVLDVFRRHAADSWRKRGECREDYIRTFKVLGFGSLALVLVIAPFSESLFMMVFGRQWQAAGTIALWMLPMFALRFVASPLSYMFYLAGKQHADLMWQVMLLIMTTLTLMLPAQYSSALMAYSAGYSMMYIIYLYLSYRFSLGSLR